MTPQQIYYNALTQQLATPYKEFNWCLTGFRKWSRDLFAAFIKDGDPDEVQDFIECGCDAEPGFIPDGYYADTKNRIVYLLEIVDSNDIDDDKAAAISDFVCCLDQAHWQMVIVLFYPKYSKTMLVWNLILLGVMAEALEGRRKPYRDAFMTLKESAA